MSAFLSVLACISVLRIVWSTWCWPLRIQASEGTRIADACPTTWRIHHAKFRLLAIPAQVMLISERYRAMLCNIWLTLRRLACSEETLCRLLQRGAPSYCKDEVPHCHALLTM